jgi:hypothetical protein
LDSSAGITKKTTPEWPYVLIGDTVAGVDAPEVKKFYRLSVPASVIQVTEIAERERLNPGSEMRREFAERTAQLGRRCNARRDIEVWLACASGRVNALIGRLWLLQTRPPSTHRRL